MLKKVVSEPASQDLRLKAPDRPLDAASHRAPWAMLGALVLCNLFNSADRQILTIVQEPMARDLRLSDSAVGSLGVFFAVAYGLATFPLAAWADRGWARRVVAGTFVGWSLMTMVCGFASSFATLGLARAGVGLGEAGCAPAAQSLIARRFPLHLRATAMGFLLTGGILGGALSAGIGGWIAHAYGWRVAFFVCGGAGLAFAPVIWMALGREARASAEATTVRGGALLRVARAYWSQKSLRFLCLAGAATGVGGAGVAQWIGSLLIREHGLSVSQAGVSLLVAMIVGGLLGAVASGLSADRLGARDPRAYALLPAFGLSLGTLAMVALALSPNALAALVAFGAIVSIANGVLAPIYTLVQRLAPKDGRATAAAFIMLTSHLVGMSLGPLLFGLASDVAQRMGNASSLRAAMLLGAGALFIGSLAALRVTFSLRADIAALEDGEPPQPPGDRLSGPRRTGKAA
jgi:MFS family permease